MQNSQPTASSRLILFFFVIHERGVHSSVWSVLKSIKKSNRTGLNGLNKIKPDWTELKKNRTGPNRLKRSGPILTVSDRLDHIRPDRFGALDRFGPDHSVLNFFLFIFFLNSNRSGPLLNRFETF